MGMIHGNLGLRRRLVLGFGAQTLTIVVLVGERFLMVPLFLYAWGLNLYEDYLLLGAAVGFVRLVDFGMESYYSASLRLSFAAGRYEEFERHIATGLGIYLIVVFAALSVSTSFIWLPVTEYLGLSGFSEPDATIVCWVMILSRLVALPRAVIRPIYTAHGEFSRGENMFTFMSAAQTIIGAGLLLFKVSPVTYSIVLALTLYLTSWLPMLLDQRRRYPKLRYRVALPNRQELRGVGRHSGLFLVRDWGDLLLNYLPVLLIGLLARQPGSILIFSTSRALVGLARQFTIQLARSGAFEMSRQIAQQDEKGLMRLYLMLGRSIGVLTGLTSAFILLTAKPLIDLWTRGHAPFDALIIIAFLAGVLISGPTQNAAMLLNMSNVPRPLAVAASVQVCVATLLMAALVPPFGALGAAVALAFSECVFGAWSSYAASTRFRLPDLRYSAVSFGSEAAAFAMLLAVGAILATVLEPDGAVQLAVFYVVASGVIIVPAFFLAMDRSQRRRVLRQGASAIGFSRT
jgi:O-antigen/teichoic acid export membrane protein